MKRIFPLLALLAVLFVAALFLLSGTKNYAQQPRQINKQKINNVTPEPNRILPPKRK